MNKCQIIAVVLAAAYSVCSCVKHSRDARKDEDQMANVDAYNIARDTKQDMDSRLEAASQLAEGQRKRLQTELLNEVPGNLDSKTLDAIWLLAKVGDKDAAERLEQLQHSSVDVPGKIGFATLSAIAEIRQRVQD